MWLKILFSIFHVFSLIGLSFSSTLLTFGRTSLDVTKDYIRLRNSSVYRGVFLSLSNQQIHEICQDFYGFQLYVNPAADRIPEYNLLVQEMGVNGRRSFHEWGLVIMCGTNPFELRAPTSNFHYLTSAFRSKWLYQLEIPNTDPNRDDLFLENYLALSPDYVFMRQVQLEQWYLNTLQTIEALSAESPKYIDLIKDQDGLSKLSDKDRLVLCASILSSHFYQQDNLEFSLEWIIKAYKTPGAVNFVEKSVSFKSAGNKEETKRVECFLCRGFENGTDMTSKSTNLYIARSYADGESAMVLKQQIDGAIFPDKYFKNIAMLIASQTEMHYSKLVLNFPSNRIDML